MLEKRKSRRVPVSMTLNICDLYKQENSGIHNLNAPIDVTDISEHGIGFISECILPLHYYFNAAVTIAGCDSFYATLQIVRCYVLGLDIYSYGCKFVSSDEKADKSTSTP